MGIKHKKEFGVYYWDTFDDATFLVGEYDTFHEAQSSINKAYRGRIDDGGADKVDIVDSNGDILRQFSVR